MTTIYKVLGRDEWEKALARGVFEGSEVDRRDGFIHFSAAQQLRETVRRHFTARPDLILAAVDSSVLGPDLKWEESRGGDLFPHLYSVLSLDKITQAAPLPWLGETHDFPVDIPA
ncbi:DUF952 domain-containing protein [Nordella sp. HKS 07]|uniref:DUF952 domain-containing protein n=1 Tax=Nordella sp. HKS 07 TaxID=2712222 RepID=UPI0013E0F91D|nr:DUF952 domain-containing protein [Nordella sp. HKS 07]QIG48888.1 DUF952 domain-containing protein [Nordella sp. HKS 07]